ncbi:putative cytochrome C oxidase subunit, partial [Cutaneotrichosporon oleaginosum]
ARRSATTLARAGRYYSTASAEAGNEFLAQRAAVKEHAKGTTKLWRNVSFFVCIPVTILGSAWTWKLEKEHHDHIEHLKHENGGELPVRPDYEYLNIRNKPFPWGMQALFFNPEVNVPAG